MFSNSLAKISLKKICIIGSTCVHWKNRWRGVSRLSSGFLLNSQKVQSGLCPLTNLLTAILYPRVLLCSLNIKVFCQLSKMFLVHSSFKRFDKVNGITESVVLLYFTILCGTWSGILFFRHCLKIFDPFLNLLKNSSKVSAFLFIFSWLYLRYQSLQAFFNILYFSGSIGTSKIVS